MNIIGLDSDNSGLFEALLDQLAAKQLRNWLRTTYYDAHRMPRDLGMMIPPGAMQRLGAVLGWPAKAVNALAQRVYLQGAVVPTDDGLQGEVARLMAANHFESEFPQAAVSSLEHSVSFLATVPDDDIGAAITPVDALNGTGRWDGRRRALSAFVSVTERGEGEKPSAATLFTADEIIDLRVDERNRWAVVARAAQPLGRPSVEMLAYQSRIGRPFGSSRISRPVMAITDMAVRTVIRAEIGAEFYAIPQRWLMGADASAFGLDGGGQADTWKILIGRVMALGDDEDASNPRAEVGQFPQISMQPHMDQLRSLAQLFAGETSIPVSSLGISIDSNPTSADSYAASREDIIAEAEGTIRDWRGPVARSLASAAQITTGRENVEVLAQFRDPRYTSRAAAADALMKAASVMPWLAQADTAVELLGYDEITTRRLLADKHRAQARASLASLGLNGPQQ